MPSLSLEREYVQPQRSEGRNAIFRKCVDENRQMSILPLNAFEGQNRPFRKSRFCPSMLSKFVFLPLNILRGKIGFLEISEEHISVFKNLPNGTSTALHTQYKVNYAAASSFVYCWAPIVS